MGKVIFKWSVLGITGGIIYSLIEIAARGYTHWTMFLLGGICFLGVGLLNEVFPRETPLFWQSLAGGVFITLCEFVTGVIVNIELGWNVWDYSHKPFNYLGQICLENSLYWVLLSVVAIILDDFLRYKLFGGRKPSYTLF
ncbi:MAG: hypothetical protein IJZ72_02875 [Oscillospiraceae bacterium]|nr:hypothetical protein [Oscillospiraceae bacterium]